MCSRYYFAMWLAIVGLLHSTSARAGDMCEGGNSDVQPCTCPAGRVKVRDDPAKDLSCFNCDVVSARLNGTATLAYKCVRDSNAPPKSVQLGCPNAAITYIKKSAAEKNKYWLENTCTERRIQVKFNSKDVFPLCTSLSEDRSIDARKRVAVYSYCGTAPEIKSAVFDSANAR